MSPDDPPPYEAQQKEPIVDVDSVSHSFPRGLYDTTLLPLYVGHVSRHVRNREVYLFTFTLHLFHTN